MVSTFRTPLQDDWTQGRADSFIEHSPVSHIYCSRQPESLNFLTVLQRRQSASLKPVNALCCSWGKISTKVFEYHLRTIKHRESNVALTQRKGFQPQAWVEWAHSHPILRGDRHPEHRGMYLHEFCGTLTPSQVQHVDVTVSKFGLRQRALTNRKVILSHMDTGAWYSLCICGKRRPWDGSAGSVGLEVQAAI